LCLPRGPQGHEWHVHPHVDCPYSHHHYSYAHHCRDSDSHQYANQCHTKTSSSVTNSSHHCTTLLAIRSAELILQTKKTNWFRSQLNFQLLQLIVNPCRRRHSGCHARYLVHVMELDLLLHEKLALPQKVEEQTLHLQLQLKTILFTSESCFSSQKIDAVIKSFFLFQPWPCL